MFDYEKLNQNIIKVKLPELIFDEVKMWKEECDKIKNHKLSFLKMHDNAGSESNNYQITVPKFLINKGFWLPYVLRLISKICGGHHRDYFLREWPGHFDSDLWINYAYKNNFNPIHNHNGFISGVIYLQNQNDSTIFPYQNLAFKGKPGDMILFPSHIEHQVDEIKDDYERITFAFNINVDKNHERIKGHYEKK
tara:strand:- start:830 stop:1411 length:582 start_codon:yes stop_codon:yes gene_type:complete